MTSEDDLQLDSDRHRKVQELAATLQTLLDEENRITEDHGKIRYDLLEAAECLWRAIERYEDLIGVRGASENSCS